MDREALQILQNIYNHMTQGGGGFSGGGAAAAGAGNAQGMTELDRSLKNARDSLDSFNIQTQQYNKRAQASQFVASLFNKTTAASEREMGKLRTALYQNQQALDALYASGRNANDVQVRALEAEKRSLESAERRYQAEEAGSKIVRAGGSEMMSFFKQIVQINTAYQIQLTGLMQQGASGFALAGAAMEAGVDKMNAANQAMANMAQQAGQSLSMMGGKFAPLAGMALGALGQAASAAAQAQADLAKNQIRIMVAEGDKLIKTHHELAGNGVQMANGMQGLIQATEGTKLRLEDMSAVVAKHREEFARAGMSMSDAVKRVGNVAKIFASTTGSMARMDRQLLALGYTYQEQAAMAAEVIGRMSSYGATFSDKEAAEATKNMAKSMALVAEATGEDMKAKKKAIQEENANLAMEAKIQEMYQQDPKKAEAFVNSLNAMSTTQRKATRDMMIFGTIRDKDTAITMASSKGMRDTFAELNKQRVEGTLTEKSVLNTRQKFAKQTQQEMIQNSKTYGVAGYAGVGAAQESAKQQFEELQQSTKLLGVNINRTAKEIDDKADKAGKPTQPGDVNAAVYDAVEAGAIAAKKLQTEVINRIGSLAGALKSHYDQLLNDLKGIGGGTGSKLMDAILKWFPILSTALTAAALLNQFGVFKGFKDALQKYFPKSGEPGSGTLEADAPDRKGKAGKGSRIMRRARVMGRNISRSPVGSIMKSATKLAGGLAVVGNVINTGMAVMDVMDQQKEYEAAKAAGDQEGMNAARAQQGSAVGGAVGGIAGTAIGAMLGGPIGAAVGGYLGNMAGSFIGEKVGPYWDSMTQKASELAKSVSDNAGKLWTASKEKMGEWATSAGNMVKEGFKWGKDAASKAVDMISEAGNKVKEALPGLSSAMGNALKTFDNLAGRVINGVLENGTALFNKAGDAFNSAKGVLGGLMDSMSEKLSNAGSWLKEKYNQVMNNPKPAAPPTAAPAAPSPGSKPTPAASPPVATPTSKPTVNTNVKVSPTALPNKAALTAAEKAAVMETVATNTKYTNDLLISHTRNMEKLNQMMLAKLDAISGHSADSARYGKKTATNTG